MPVNVIIDVPSYLRNLRIEPFDMSLDMRDNILLFGCFMHF